MMKTSVAGVLMLLLGATAYELLVALGVIDLGSQPGEGPAGAGVVGIFAAIALVASAGLSAALARADRAPALSALLAPAAGVFLVAHFYTYDPYYLPTLIRYAEREFVPPILVFALAAAALAGGLVTLRRRRIGLALSVPTILMCALAAFWAGIGH